MQDFLLELGFEELPARFVEGALEQLADTLGKRLKQERLEYGEVLLYSTPRRLTVLVRDLSKQQSDLVEEVKGPPKNIAYDTNGNLTKAGQGFLRSQGVDEGAISIKQFQGADYLFVTKEVLGQPTSVVLKPLLEDIISHLGFPKNMRWGSYDLRYARPLRWIIALFGTEVIPVQVGPVAADRITYGHRQLAPGALMIREPKEYVNTLRSHYVLADASKRSEIIWEQIQKLAQAHGAKVSLDQDLLQEVVNLVEYPTAFCGTFDPEYLDIPSEVLVTSMKEHQRYFPVEDGEGQLLPKFIGIRNGADNHLETVVNGNEKVLAARLADAKFFFDEDRKASLEDNLQKLEQVVFQEGLGSMGEKVERIECLSLSLTELLGLSAQRDTILRTARLAKADLVSQMVYEFPELQGIMGGKYALLQGEDPAVATGIREHYQPRFAGDSLPNTMEGTIVSLADKLDTLVGYFALGRIPTGSQDPFALRRQAQGVVQILLKTGFDVPLNTLIELAASGYTEVSLSHEHAQALEEFFLARLRVILLEQGYAYDLVDAVMATGDQGIKIPDLLGKVQALDGIRATDIFSDLMTGFERVANLAGKYQGETLNPEAFLPADAQFEQAVRALEQQCRTCFSTKDYAGVLSSLAQFRTAVDQFFTEVMIMDKDPVVRGNRLALLQKALRIYILYGDFHLIVLNR
ncbi:MAG: glycine--tRNA ligase subunit beta [Firmicutes bacterium]|nr:glycine--tRNA ligase subunit beta [Bacillota bacterium]